MRFLFRFFRRIFFWAIVIVVLLIIFFRPDEDPYVREPEIRSDAFNPPIPPARDPITPDAPIEQVYVDKSERKMWLRTRGMDLREYNIALGFAPQGHKTTQGDGKTPIGEYTLDWRNPKSSFYRSLHISYPSREQVEAARAQGIDPGGMIMIHGQPNGMKLKPNEKIGVDWTDGCIAVSNAEMDEIWARVKDGTKIIITE